MNGGVSGENLPKDEESPRVAGVDYGRARIGLAVSDELGFLAHPRDFIPARPPQRALRLLVKALKQDAVARILLGLPINLDGTEGKSAQRAREFGAQLAELSGLPVEFVDERLSTVEAQLRLRESGQDVRSTRAKIDSASAAVLLQGWLDGRREA